MATDTHKETDEQLRKLYGEGVKFSRLGIWILIHLDNPTPEEIKVREWNFSPDDYLQDNCLLCATAREEGGHIVFDPVEDVVIERSVLDADAK